MNGLKKDITDESYFQEIDYLFHLIKKTTFDYNEKLRNLHLDITGPQLMVIKIIKEYPHYTLSQLSEILHCHITTIEGYIERLEEKGYVKRFRSNKDKRVRLASLTDKGEEIIGYAPEDYRTKLKENLKVLSSLEKKIIYNSLLKLVELYGITEEDTIIKNN